MILTLWILGCLAFSVVMLACGAAIGFIWFGRGTWMPFLDKQIRPRPVEFVAAQIKECVDEGIFTIEQARKFADKLWTDEVRADMKDRWAQMQRSAVSEERMQSEQRTLDDLRRDLGTG